MASAKSLLHYRLILIISFVLIGCMIYVLYTIGPLKVTLRFMPKTAEVEYESSILTPGLFVKNCISNSIIGEVANATSKTSGDAVVDGRNEDPADRKESFADIFDKQSWGGDGVEFAHSGVGSTLDYANEVISNLNIIVDAIKKEKGDDYVVKILDVACGDLQWMPRFLDMRKGDVNYTGMDIVPAVISHHKEKFKNQKWTFILQDIVETEKLSAYDVIVSRMFMQHLLNADVMKVLRTFSQSGSTYMFATTFLEWTSNYELNHRNKIRFRRLNLELPPFSLTHPLCYGNDGPRADGHFLGLWRLPLEYMKNCRGSQSRGAGRTCSNTTFYQDFF